MTGLSSETFETQTAAIPGTISGAPVEGEVIPPGAPAEAETGWPIFDVQQICALPFFLLARRYGDLWKIDDEEEQALARAWKPILDRYAPLEDTPLGLCALVTLAVVGPRVMATDWNKGKKPAAAPSAQNSTPRASTKTAASGESVSTSENAKAASQPGWDVFSNP